MHPVNRDRSQPKIVCASRPVLGGAMSICMSSPYGLEVNVDDPVHIHGIRISGAARIHFQYYKFKIGNVEVDPLRFHSSSASTEDWSTNYYKSLAEHFERMIIREVETVLKDDPDIIKSCYYSKLEDACLEGMRRFISYEGKAATDPEHERIYRDMQKDLIKQLDGLDTCAHQHQDAFDFGHGYVVESDGTLLFRPAQWSNDTPKGWFGRVVHTRFVDAIKTCMMANKSFDTISLVQINGDSLWKITPEGMTHALPDPDRATPVERKGRPDPLPAWI